MGEEIYTEEEKVILGEKEPEPPKEPGTPAPKEGELKPSEEAKPEPKEEEKEPEQTPEEKQAMESMGLRVEKGYILDDDGTKIPAKRWKSMYRDFQEERRTRTETDRKFNLFRELGPDKYYEIYADEKPADWKPAETKKEAVTSETAALGTMVVQGGPHNGKTLNEVWQEDPAYASYLQTQYLTAQNQKVETERQTQERIKEESEEEVNTFSEQLSKDMFGKESSKLSPDEEKKIGGTIQSVLDWMGKTRRGGGVLADAYFLMNREGIISEAKAKGGKEALASLQKPIIPSVNTGGGAAVTGFSAYEAMSADELAKEVEKMAEAKYQKFLKEAPQSLKTKHPTLPWF